MTETWTQFKGRHSAADLKAPTVTVQVSGNLGLNEAAYNLIGRPDRIVYLTDGSGKRFGIRAAKAGDSDTYPVRAQQSGRSYVLAGKLFLKWIGFPYGDGIHKFPIRMENGIGVVDLE